MEIFVLLKQVPATESLIEIDADGVSIKTSDIKWVINPYDEYALEEALRIRDAQGGTVTILSVGPEKTVEAIRTALAMGADKGILINVPGAGACDNLGIARILAAVLKDLSFDLIIAGQRAVDDDNFQVGLAVAEYLEIPSISLVIQAQIAAGKIRCHRTVEGGIHVLEASFPALFTTQRGLNEPRYASLPGIMKAKKKPLDIKTFSDSGIDPEYIGKPQVKLHKLMLPPARSAVKVIAGESPAEKAALLARLLHQEAKVI